MMLWQFAQHGIAGDGAQQAVCIVVTLIGFAVGSSLCGKKGYGVPGDEFTQMLVLVWRKRKLVELKRAHSDELIVTQRIGLLCTERIDYVHVFQLRRLHWKRFVFTVVIR